MIFAKPDANSSPHEINNYLTIPGLLSYVAGIWIINLNYWGCNQYITQRALGANLPTARKGILFAGFLKLLMPLIVMLPGIAAYVLHQKGMIQAEMLVHSKHGEVVPDNAYSAILGYLPNGLIGLSLAALTAAIVASLAGKANSISTIFTLDVYKKYINKEADEQKMVWIGRLTIIGRSFPFHPPHLEGRPQYRRHRRVHLYSKIYRLYQPRSFCHVLTGHVLETDHRSSRRGRRHRRLLPFRFLQRIRAGAARQ